MRWGSALVAALMLLAAAESFAHKIPARRSVTVQADPSTAAVLVMWTSARGHQGAQMLARASWGRSSNATKALRAQCSVRALRGLAFRDGAGAIIQPKNVQVKVRVDEGSRSFGANGGDPPRIVCAVLLDFAKIGDRGSLVVHASGKTETRLRWLDHSRRGVFSESPPKRWLGAKDGAKDELRLFWRSPAN